MLLHLGQLLHLGLQQPRTPIPIIQTHNVRSNQNCEEKKE